eukprot:TRINITY_DN69747_c0_g1_i1.p1 TRINITY_DN69747_c0_g1~~TRINITY_DN69747_c0_g1_i1.p1  ORF type:complete len:152 (+),score=24.04 TRINITY_DN69747_c0_g1_i1:77-532(+)
MEPDLRLSKQASLYPAHPMMPQYLRNSDLPDVNVRNLWKLREQGNCVLPTNMSATCKSFKASPAANEFGTSLSSFSDRMRKHTRSPSAPCEKYNLGAASSHEIGWFVENTRSAHIMGLPRKPTYPLSSSEPTKYVNNMKATRSEAAMRLIL